MRDALRVAAIVLGWTVAADVVGVLACLFLDIAPLRYESAALPFVVWFVLGVFCGVAAFWSAGTSLGKDKNEDWVDLPDAPRRGKLILAVTAVLYAALSFLFHRSMWRFHPSGELYVPDTRSLTLTFFGGILAAMAFFAFTCGPIRTKRKR